MNLILLCHGSRRDWGSFTLARNQTVQYRGNFGTPLSESVARTLVAALLSDPTVTDIQLQASIPNYNPQPPLEGPNTFAPDFDLAGDDHLLCFLLNMNNRRWAPLPSGWSTTLGRFLTDLGTSQAFWLNLLCCSGNGADRAWVNPYTEVTRWDQVLR